MASITTRSGKGSPLTNAEVDGNFLSLNAEKFEAKDLATDVEAAAGSSRTKLMTPFTTATQIHTHIVDDLGTNQSQLALSAAQGKILNDTKAPLDSPNFTGVPLVPTAAAGTSSRQAASTEFVTAAVEAAKAGLTTKGSCKAVATTNITLSGTQTIDGVALVAGNRVLVVGQSSAAANGAYVVAAGAWSRATDFDSSGEIVAGSALFVEQGTNYANSTWTLITTGTVVVGSTDLLFTQSSGAGQISAGNGLQKIGNTLALAALPSGQILVGDGSNSATARAVSGDITLSNLGVASIANGAITNTHISPSALISDTKLSTISSSGKVANSATTATSSSTGNTIVSRDSSGDFSAGIITAALNGNAKSATNWATGRTLTLTGDTTGTSAPFDGSTSITLLTTLGNSGVTAGTYGGAGTIPTLSIDAKGRVFAASNVSPSGTYNISISGVAATATKLASGRSIQLTGDVTGISPLFDGSGNISFSTTLGSSGVIAGTYGGNISIPQLAVDSKGRVTAASAITPSGQWPISISGTAATAAALSPGCTINGVSFTGATNVTIPTAPDVRFFANIGSAAAPGYTFYNLAIGAFSDGAIYGLSVGGIERARINSSGYLKVSNTGSYNDPINSSHEIASSAASNAVLRIESTNLNYTGTAVASLVGRGTTNSSYSFFTGTVTGVAVRFAVRDSGNVENVNGSYGSISDSRLKQDITDAGSQWEDFKALRFRRFRFRKDIELGYGNNYQLGVIAQEVEETSPGLVYEAPMYQGGEGETPEEPAQSYKAVKQSVLMMKGMVALQEALERIEALEARVTELENA